MEKPYANPTARKRQGPESAPNDAAGDGPALTTGPSPNASFRFTKF